MANNFNLKGTVFPSFRIGANGPTIRQSTVVPNLGDGIAGDIWIVVNGASSGMYQKGSTDWVVVSNPTLGTLGDLTPDLDAFIVGDGTSWTTETGSNARNSLGLGTADAVTFASINVPLITSANLTVQGNLTVNGTTTTVNSSILEVSDKNITVNKSGVAASGTVSGLEIEEDGLITGYMRSAADRTNLEFKAPGGSVLTVDVNATSLFTISNNLTVSGVSAINQDVTTTGDPTFGTITTTDITENSLAGSLKLGAPAAGSYTGAAGQFNAEEIFVDGTAVAVLGVSNLNDLSDVVISGVASGNILYYNGTNFVNAAPGATSGVQPYDSDLAVIAGFAHTDGNFIVSNGTNWVLESGNDARTSLGVGTSNSPQFNGLLISNNTDSIVKLRHDSAVLDEKRWELHTSSGEFAIRTTDDADTISENAIVMDRNGTSVSSITLRTANKDRVNVDDLGVIKQGQAGNGGQTGQYIMSRLTSNATPTELFVDGVTSERLVLNDQTSWFFDIQLIARRTDADNETARYRIEGAIDRNTGVSTVALVGDPSIIGNEDSLSWNVDVDADTLNGSLRIRVTGEVGKTIKWAALVRSVEVSV